MRYGVIPQQKVTCENRIRAFNLLYQPYTRARGRDYHNSDLFEIPSMKLITSRYRLRTGAARQKAKNPHEDRRNAEENTPNATEAKSVCVRGLAPAHHAPRSRRSR